MNDQPAASPLQITVEELYELIGRQLVEIRLLRARLAALTPPEPDIQPDPGRS